MERQDFRKQRIFVEGALSEGSAVDADRAQANYLLSVLRLGETDNVLLFNGRDGEWLAAIEPAGRKKCRLVPVTRTRPQPRPPSLIYCFAPLKHARLDYMVQKAVEMGAGVLQPVLTQYTQNRRLNLERMRANAIEAAEQCGILSIPQVRDPVTLEVLLGQWRGDHCLIFCDEAASDPDPVPHLKPLEGRPLAVLIGPEGGFSQAERELLISHRFVTPIPLGPRILRADTAAVAALAAVQMIAGDWRREESE
jgi:16S rRNA (uracil1498-N3)-methyltransferase